MIWSVPKVWKNSTVVVIGGGPSILRQFDVPQNVIQSVYTGQSQPSVYSPYLKPLHDKHIIAVNMAYKLGTWIDIMFFGDPSFWRRFSKELLLFKGLRVTCASSLLNEGGVKSVKRGRAKGKRPFGISTDPSTICWNNNSGASAINLAVLLGAGRIILLGFDMALDAQKNQHWHKIYSSKPTAGPSTFRKHLQGFPAISADLKALGIECINANPESAIVDFPRVNYRDIK